MKDDFYLSIEGESDVLELGNTSHEKSKKIAYFYSLQYPNKLVQWWKEYSEGWSFMGAYRDGKPDETI